MLYKFRLLSCCLLQTLAQNYTTDHLKHHFQRVQGLITTKSRRRVGRTTTIAMNCGSYPKSPDCCGCWCSWPLLMQLWANAWRVENWKTRKTNLIKLGDSLQAPTEVVCCCCAPHTFIICFVFKFSFLIFLIYFYFCYFYTLEFCSRCADHTPCLQFRTNWTELNAWPAGFI